MLPDFTLLAATLISLSWFLAMPDQRCCQPRISVWIFRADSLTGSWSECIPVCHFNDRAKADDLHNVYNRWSSSRRSIFINFVLIKDEHSVRESIRANSFDVQLLYPRALLNSFQSVSVAVLDLYSRLLSSRLRSQEISSVDLSPGFSRLNLSSRSLRLHF